MRIARDSSVLLPAQEGQAWADDDTELPVEDCCILMTLSCLELKRQYQEQGFGHNVAPDVVTFFLNYHSAPLPSLLPLLHQAKTTCVRRFRCFWKRVD